MCSSAVGPTEDTVMALLDYFVDPLLPPKLYRPETLPLHRQEAIAKQVHAVVVLYNYYHRKQQLSMEFLGFESFCKLAVIIKPTLLSFMKLMQGRGRTHLGDENLERHLSVVENAIMNACNVSLGLDASKDTPNIEGWPSTNISIFLVDFACENCFMLYSSVTEGAWSVIENDVDSSTSRPNVVVDSAPVNKKKRITKKPVKDMCTTAGIDFQQLAFSAIKEVTGISSDDLLVLERHSVYSVSKDKAVSRFFIVKFARSINDVVFQVPVTSLVSSLQGPLVERSSFGWTVTPMVEYFHVLPFAGILFGWFSREVSSTTLKYSTVKKVDENVNYLHVAGEPSSIEANEMNEQISCKAGNQSNDSTKKATTVENSPILPHHDDNGCRTRSYSTAFCESGVMNEDGSANGSWSVGDYCLPRLSSLKNATRSSSMEKITKPNYHERSPGIKDTKSCVSEPVAVGCHPGSQPVDKPHSTASRNSILLQAALRALSRKREGLCNQQRIIEEEIARCDEIIQTILTSMIPHPVSSPKDDFLFKMESIIEGCFGASLISSSPSQGRTCPVSEGEPISTKKKRLSEASLTVQNPCQELELICHQNVWMLPTYHVTTRDGGFQAEITVKGMDFECSSGGDLLANPRDARKSAAIQMLVKLRSMPKAC